MTMLVSFIGCCVLLFLVLIVGKSVGMRARIHQFAEARANRAARNQAQPSPAAAAHAIVLIPSSGYEGSNESSSVYSESEHESDDHQFSSDSEDIFEFNPAPDWHFKLVDLSSVKCFLQRSHEFICTSRQ